MQLNQSPLRRLLPQMLLAVTAGALYFVNLGLPALWDIDEPRNAVCAREMLDRGDWIVPTFNGELRAHKPILLYWLMMLAYKAFGVSEFAARFWSAGLSIGTVLVAYHVARRLFGNRAALLAALALASSVNFVLVARAATPDALFVFFTTAALAAFVFASTKVDRRGVAVRWRMPRAPGLAGVYLLTGLAMLAKGPVALIVVLGSLLLYLTMRYMPPAVNSPTPALLCWTSVRAAMISLLQRLKQGATQALRRMRPLLAAAIIGAVVLPWYAAVCALTGGKWLSDFLFTHNLSRFMSPMENHRGPIFYYLIAVCVGFFPWSLFIYPSLKRTVAGWKQRDPRSQSYLFLTCWIGVVFGFFSLAATKLPSYIMPAYPALAILTGVTLDLLLLRAARAEALVWLRRASWTLVLTGAVLVAILPIVTSIFLPGEQLLGMLGIVPISGGLLCLLMVSRQRVGAAVATFASAAAVFCLAAFGICQVRITRHHDTPGLIHSIQSDAHGRPVQIAGFDHFRPSWVYYANTRVSEFFDIDQVLKFFDVPQGRYLVTTDKGLKKIQRLLPDDVAVVAQQKRFMHRGKLLVLARQTSTTLPRRSTAHKGRPPALGSFALHSLGTVGPPLATSELLATSFNPDSLPIQMSRLPRSVRYQLLLTALCGFLFFFRLGAVRVWDIDEAIFSQTAWEMMDRGDYVVPYFNDRVLPDKPALTYWAMISSYKLFGPTEFAARFWSAIAAIGTVLLTYRLAMRLLGPGAGFWSALVLGTSFNFCVIARAATPDSLLVFFSTLSILMLFEGTLGHQSGEGKGVTLLCDPSRNRWVIAYAAMAVGVLVKGPIGVLLPLGSYIFFRIGFGAFSPAVNVDAQLCAIDWQALAPRALTRLFWQLRPLTGLTTLILMAGPWYALVAARTGGSWLWGFLGVHNVGRFLSPMDEHSGGALYYPLVTLFGFLPWSVLLAPIALHVTRTIRRREDGWAVQLFAVTWAATYIGFFSLARTKLPSYIVPAYPALALLAGTAIEHWIARPSRLTAFWRQACWGVLLLLGVCALIGFWQLTRIHLPAERLLSLLAIIPICGGLAGLWNCARQNLPRAIKSLAATAVVAMVALFGFVLVRVDRYQASSQLDFVLRHSEEPALASFFYFRPSFVFYSKQPVTKLTSAEMIQQFFAAHAKNAFVITTGEHMFRLAGRMPDGVCILEERPRFLQHGNIVVLGRRETLSDGRRLAAAND